MFRLISFFFILFFMTFFSGCALSPRAKYADQHTYLLNKLPVMTKSKKKHPWTLIVASPKVDSPYDTTQIAYMLKPRQIAWFAKNSWAASPGEMLQTLLVQTLQNTKDFYAVLPAAISLRKSRFLYTEIVEMKENDVTLSPYFSFVLRVWLVDPDRDEVISEDTFRAQHPLLENTPYAGIIAANNAVADVLKKVADFRITDARVRH